MTASSTKALLVVGGLALVLYPCALFANLMTLAGHRTGNEPAIAMAMVYAFLGMTSIYPLVYLAAWLVVKRSEKPGGNAKTARWAASMPLLWLTCAFGLFCLGGAIAGIAAG